MTEYMNLKHKQPNHHYRLLILDFDGTIGDTNKIIITTMQSVISELNLPEVSDADCQKTIGLPLAKCFQAVLPQLSDSEAEDCAARYRLIFDELKRTIHVSPFPHVLDTLKALHDRGQLLAIASSRAHESLDKFVTDMKLDNYVQMVIGADDVVYAKPDPEPVEMILKALNVAPAEALVVGDAPYDILMGRRAGCATCGVSYGNAPAEELLQAGADYIIDDFAQLLEF